jgi:hypothetical protein
MQPTGMSPQRCISALKSLRAQLAVRPGVSTVTGNQFDRASIRAPDDEIGALKGSLRLNIELRSEGSATDGMSVIEREVYLPAIVSILKLLERVEPFVAIGGRLFVEDAVALADRALQRATACDRPHWRAAH